MNRFAALVDRLAQTSDQTVEARLVASYFRATDDSGRGPALALLRGDWPSATGGQRLLRDLAGMLVPATIDPTLYQLSRKASGDTAETIALLWPGGLSAGASPAVAEIGGSPTADSLRPLLDRLDVTARVLLIRLAAKGPSRLASASSLKRALATLGSRSLAELDDIWPSLRPPYADFFVWLEGKGGDDGSRINDRPRPPPAYRRLSLETAKSIASNGAIAQWLAEGLGVTVFASNSARQLVTESGEDVAAGFPELLDGLSGDIIALGQIAAIEEGGFGSAHLLKIRQNQLAVTASMRRRAPARLRLFDVSRLSGEDISYWPFLDRVRRLRASLAEFSSPVIEWVEPLEIQNTPGLQQHLAAPPSAGLSGLLLRPVHHDGEPHGFVARPRHAGLFVLMYVERQVEPMTAASGRLLTLGVFPDAKLGSAVPAGKVLARFAAVDARRFDAFVAEHRTERFGPVTAVLPTLAVRADFAGAQAAPRRKAGLALRDLELIEIAWDQPVAKVLRLERLKHALAPDFAGFDEE